MTSLRIAAVGVILGCASAVASPARPVPLMASAAAVPVSRGAGDAPAASRAAGDASPNVVVGHYATKPACEATGRQGLAAQRWTRFSCYQVTGQPRWSLATPKRSGPPPRPSAG